AGLAGLVADRVAVIEDLGAAVLELDHGAYVLGHGLLGTQCELLRVLLGLVLPVIDADAERQVGQRVMSGGLVGDDVGLGGFGSVEDHGQDLGGIADQPHGQGLLVLLGLDDLARAVSRSVSTSSR